MKIPYGQSDFIELRRSGYFYVDKTMLLPVLEHADTARYLLFLRPRRFGKSLLISMLATYYDLAHAARFDELFSGLYVHQEPTPERGRHLVLRFDFSTVSTGVGKEHLEASFVETVKRGARIFLQRYQAWVPFYQQVLAHLDEFNDATNILLNLFGTQLPDGNRIYVLIDEYDAFANELISGQRIGLYHEVVEGTGFLRTFFKTIKAATGHDGPVGRLFATGVSPMALDDMASGFNIATQITLDGRFNALCGFTRGEVEQVVDAFLVQTPQLGPREPLVGDLVGSYNGYCFAEDTEERICNPDMVLYYLMHLRTRRKPPQELLDKNVRTDYGKLRQLSAPPSGAEEWQREILETILGDGGISSPLVDRFGLRRLYEPAHLVSLLFYMGLLTIAGQKEGLLRLEVPNLVMRRMHWEELTLMLREQSGALLDVGRLAMAVSRMAYHGDLQTFLTLIQDRVLTVLSNRDLIQLDEKHLKMILLAYLSLSPIYRLLSEKEVAQGYSDLLLALDRRYPDARYAYLLELKYLRTGATDEEVAAKRAEGEAQIRRYLRDDGLLPTLLGERTILSAVIVFRGAREHHLFMHG